MTDIKKIVFLFLIILIITILNLNNILGSQQYQNQEIKSCEYSTLEVLNYYDEQGLDYQAKYEYISVFPELNNIKCLGKAINIDKTESGLIIIYTSINNLIKNFIVVSLPMLLFFLLNLIKINKSINIFLLFVLFLNLNFWTYSIDLTFLNIKLIFLLLTYLFIFHKYKNLDNVKIEKFMLFISVFLGVLYSSFDFTKILHANEYGYVGEFFKVQNEYSSYIGNLSNSFIWEGMVIFLETLFGDSFIIYFKILVFISTAILIFKLLELFNVSLISGLLIMFIYSPNSPVAGGDVMYGWLEPRTLSYLFFLSGIYFAYKENLNTSFILYTISFLFHFGVSIVNFPIYFYVLLRKFKTKDIFKYGFFYIIALSPFIFSLLREQGVKNESNTFYYIVERSPHHLYPFIRENNEILEFSSQEWSTGLLFFSLVFVISFLVKRYLRENQFNDIGSLTIATGLVCIANLLIAYFFPFSRYILLHPFRTFSVFTFFSTIFLIQSGITIFNKYDFELKPKVYLIILWIVIFPTYFLDDSKYYYSNLSEYQAAESKYYIKNKNPEVLIINPYAYTAFWSGFESDYQIPTYLIRKYTPNNLSKMDIYLERLDELVRFYDGDCDALNHLPDFLYVDKVENNPCGELVYSEYNFYIYEKIN